MCVRETVTLNNVTSAEEKRHIIGDTFAMVRGRGEDKCDDDLATPDCYGIDG